MSLACLFISSRIINECYYYHCWVPLQLLLCKFLGLFYYFFFKFFLYYDIIYYIENATVKRVHACYYYPKGEIFQTDIYITCHCRICFEKFNWLPICEMWSFILFTIWWQFCRCLHFFRIIIMRFHYINRQLYRSLEIIFKKHV